jgi:Squalene-hopene cyclase C-terminal domain
MAEQKAISFLEREVPAWSKLNGCFSCHNNGDGTRALYLAVEKHHRVAAPALIATTKWLSAPNSWDHNKGDPGFSDLRLANIEFGASLSSAINANLIQSKAPLAQAAGRIAADQDASGAWSIDRGNPVGSPATYGTPLATYLAMRTLSEAGHFTQNVARAKSFLRTVRPNNTSSAATILLAFPSDEAAQNKEALDFLLRAQTTDGGWGPYRDSAPEIFDTALALLALNGVSSDPKVKRTIERGRAFLLREQLSDGSWPASTRPAGGQSYAQQVSTTAWALIALLQTER